jgi:hypothetical protein
MPLTKEYISTEALYEALEEVLSHKDGTPQSYWLRYYEASDNALANEALFFLKPEATDPDSGVHTKEIIQMTLDAYEHWGFQVGAVRIINTDYLKHYQIMEKHYGVINKISRIGEEALSPAIKQAMHGAFAEELARGAIILGGHQMLQRFPHLSAFGLMLINDNLGRKKFAPGTYATAPIVVEGTTYIILDTFHAYQLEHFIQTGRALILFDVHFPEKWNRMHSDFLGTTKPQDAVASSIRHQFLEHATKLGLSEINIFSNYLHGSAGPLEGMVELQRFFTDPERESLSYNITSFGKLLLQYGMRVSDIELLARNPLFEVDGKTISVFDLTEEMDAAAAAEKLTSLVKNQKPVE